MRCLRGGYAAVLADRAPDDLWQRDAFTGAPRTTRRFCFQAAPVDDPSHTGHLVCPAHGMSWRGVLAEMIECSSITC